MKKVVKENSIKMGSQVQLKPLEEVKEMALYQLKRCIKPRLFHQMLQLSIKRKEQVKLLLHMSRNRTKNNKRE